MTRWDSDNVNAAHTQRELEQEYGGDCVSDLVKRLRDPCGHSPNSMDGYERDAVGFRDKICTEAAACIEQLERELAEVRADGYTWRDLALKRGGQLAAEKALADQGREVVQHWVDHSHHPCQLSDEFLAAYRKARGL